MLAIYDPNSLSFWSPEVVVRAAPQLHDFGHRSWSRQPQQYLAAHAMAWCPSPSMCAHTNTFDYRGPESWDKLLSFENFLCSRRRFNLSCCRFLSFSSLTCCNCDDDPGTEGAAVAASKRKTQRLLQGTQIHVPPSSGEVVLCAAQGEQRGSQRGTFSQYSTY